MTIGQRPVEIMIVFSPKVRSLKAKILQVQILSKFKFSNDFFEIFPKFFLLSVMESKGDSKSTTIFLVGEEL